jgi:phage terminase large subunit-like protein
LQNVPLPKAFQFLFEEARYKAAYGGRGSAKSHSFAKALLVQAGERKLRILCAREVQNSIKDSVKLLLDTQIEELGMSDFFSSTQMEIRAENGSRFIFSGLGEHTVDTIKSYEAIDIVWVEEAQTISAGSLEILIPTIRKPGSQLWFSWNPRHASDPVDRRFRSEDPPPGALIHKVNHYDNPFFPDELEQERVYDKRIKPDRYAHIWLGEYEPQAIGAIWTRQGIQDARTSLPRLEKAGIVMERIVVGVDPAVSDTEVSDEHGIAVAGKGSDGRGYLLEDASTSGSPSKWAGRAWSMADKWEADAVVVERNQGGDMVKHTLLSARPQSGAGRIIEVHAAKGKHVRAEPISALCEQGHAGFAGSFPDLEAQLCLFTSQGYEGEGSPDRAEAYIWAMTELFPKIIRKKPKVTLNQERRVSWMG